MELKILMQIPCSLFQNLKLKVTLKSYLIKPRCKKGFRQHSFCVRSIDPWNSLSAEVINSSTVNEFKTKLDTEWRHIRFNVDNVY